jgi:hypothetical protein
MRSFRPWSIKSFMRSTYPLVWGRVTAAQSTWMLLPSQKSKNLFLVNWALLSVMVEFGTPKVENDALDKAYHFLGADLSQGPSLNLFSELVDHDKQVGEAPGCFLEESQEVQAPHSKRPCDGDGLEPLGRHVDLSCKVLEPLARPHDLDCIIGGRWPVKVLS